MQISINVSNLRQHREDSIDGEIWFHTREINFPSAHWFDYPFAFLSYLADRIEKLYRDKINYADISFMDGPYVVEINKEKGNNKIWNIVFSRSQYILDEEREERTVQYQGQVDVPVFIKHLIDVTEESQRELQSKGWQSSDSDSLYKKAKRLQKLVKL